MDGVTAIGIESFHWISPNWISIGSVENWIVRCIDTGCRGIDDGIECFVVDDDDKGVCLRLLSNVNDCVVPPINSYSSVDVDGVGVISSFCLDEVVSIFGFCCIGVVLLVLGYLRGGWRIKWFRSKSLPEMKNWSFRVID